MLSVLIPTYRRPQDLCRCLAALEAQTRPADDVWVVVRDSDEETQDFLAGCQTSLPLRRVCVGTPGVITAMNAGLEAASGDIIALTDDDTAPYPDWLERIEAHFAADPMVGGVGGRDRVHQPDGAAHDAYLHDAYLHNACLVVGKVQWFGRIIGNHHLGAGPAREVDVLKGANCAYRAAALRPVGFDARMRGSGAQVHWELSLGLALKRGGWKLLYDPAVLVNHYPASRFDEDQRGRFDWGAHRNAVCNEGLALLGHLPWPRQLCYLGYALMLGTREAPGLLQLPRLLFRREPHLWSRIGATLAGRAAGVSAQTCMRGETLMRPREKRIEDR